jgi:uncharacterized membrane-anchored protein
VTFDAGRSGPLTGARAASKVPEITVFFWITKALTTAMGESTSDYLVHRIDPVVAVLIGFVALLGALALQLAVSKYIAWVYWLAVVMVGIFGTMAADVLHVGFGVPYAASTALYLVVLIVVFVLWYRTEGTLSIHSIYTRRRELFYWDTVIATFALGTAAGDFAATTVGLGYFSSAVVFAVVITIPALAYWRFGLGPIAAFWLSYVATRPLGASVADWLSVSRARGGLDLGTGPVSLGFAALIACFVGYLAISRVDVPGRH